MKQKKLTFLLSLLLMIFSQGAFSQEQDFDYHRDFEALLSQSKDSKSPLYYPQLLKRFSENDKTLSNKEVLALLIGYTASEHYRPYQTIEAERYILALVQQEKYREGLAACNQLLKLNPVNLTALMEKGFICSKLKLDSLDFHRDKHIKVLHAISSSGDGSLEKPYFVLSPIDGQVLIRHTWGGSIRTMASGSDKRGYFLDMLEFLKEGQEPKMLHFNIAHATARMFSEEKKAEMQDLFEDNDVLSKKKKPKN